MPTSVRPQGCNINRGKGEHNRSPPIYPDRDEASDHRYIVPVLFRAVSIEAHIVRKSGIPRNSCVYLCIKVKVEAGGRRLGHLARSCAVVFPVFFSVAPSGEAARL